MNPRFIPPPGVPVEFRTMAEILAMAARATTVPESMFVRQVTNTSEEVRQARRAFFEHWNLLYYRRDLLTVLTHRARKCRDV